MSPATFATDSNARFAASTPQGAFGESVDARRFQALFSANMDFIWRSARRLGLSNAESDDATQQAFIIAARRLGKIEEGKERAFLFQTVTNVVRNVRRSHARRREELSEEVDLISEELRPDEELARANARAVADQIVASLELDLRTVFVLYELEELAIPAIAELLEIPAGTASSRLRRAREEFQLAVKRFRNSEMRGAK